jgi:hypothetical protein
MAENSAEKRESFERWVASLKSSDPRASDPGSSPGSSPGSDERPVAPPELAAFDERATTVHRIPKDMIQKLRAREASRSLPPEEDRDSSPAESRPSQPDSDRQREMARSLAQVDTDSTAVFVPPPELLLRAKRMNAPRKPKAANSSEAITEPPAPDFSTPAPNLEPPSLDAFLRSLPPVEESGTHPRSDLERQESEASATQPPVLAEAVVPESPAAWRSVAPPAFRPSRKRLLAWGAVMAIVALGMAVLVYWKLHGFH